MGVCSTVLFVLFIVISPSNPPWYYFVIGLVVLLVIHALMSKTVFSQMADGLNMKNLRKINDED
jgi:CDP-diglyceride synthetase